MEDLSELLKPLLDETDVPSVAAAVVFGSEIHAAGAVGVRKRGDPTPVTVNDKYHIGSCAKAMTATLAGILVERGVLSWETQLGEVFPDIEIHPGYRQATLKQLLSHTAGMPGNKFVASGGYDDDEEDDMPDGLTPTEERAFLVSDLLKRNPPYTPGEVYDYANVGYSVAGAVLEQLTQTPFETLLERELFVLLGVTSAGFGAAGTPGQVDEPWGHDPEPVEPGPEADNPIYMSPAGTVHMTITDFAKHAAFHLTGEPPLLKRETLELLHTPILDDYALGWGVIRSEWAGGVGLTHAGSNTLSYAVIGLALSKSKAVVCATNQADEKAKAACSAVFRELVKRFL